MKGMVHIRKERRKKWKLSWKGGEFDGDSRAERRGAWRESWSQYKVKRGMGK